MGESSKRGRIGALALVAAVIVLGMYLAVGRWGFALLVGLGAAAYLQPLFRVELKRGILVALLVAFVAATAAEFYLDSRTEESFRDEIARVEDIAAPAMLEPVYHTTFPHGDVQRAVFRLRPTKDAPLGTLTFVAFIQGTSEERIVDFVPAKGHPPYHALANWKQIWRNGRYASLTYIPIVTDTIALRVDLTGPCGVALTGNLIEGQTGLIIIPTPMSETVEEAAQPN